MTNPTSSSESSFFAPAIGLMNRMKYPQKFLLISLLFAAPTFVLIFLVTAVRNEAIDFGAKEQLGIEYCVPAKVFLADAQDLRTVTNRYLNGDNSVRDKIITLQSKLEQDITVIDALDQKLGQTLETTVKWNTLKAKWQALKSKTLDMQAKESYAVSTEFIAGIVDLIASAGDASNLILDPDLDSYYIMDCIVSTLPVLMQDVQSALDLSNNYAQGKTLSPDESAQLIFILPGNIKTTFGNLQRSVGVAYKANPTLVTQMGKEYEEATLAVNAFLKTTAAKGGGIDSSAFKPNDHAAKGAAAALAVRKLYDVQAGELQKLIDKRIAGFTLQKRIIQVAVPIVFLLVIYLLVGFYKSVMRTVASFTAISRQLITGDAMQPVVLEAKDELSKVGESFNAIGQALVERNQALELSQLKLEQGLYQLEESNRQIQDQQVQLIQAEKMSSLGQMVAGIAHEVNTPLGYVRGNVESIQEAHGELSQAAQRLKLTQEKILGGHLDDLETILHDNQAVLNELDRNPAHEHAVVLIDGALSGLDRIQELVTGLRNFSRLDEANRKEADINAGIDSALVIAHNATKNVITVVKNYGQIPMVKCYIAQLNQVFLNLILNAAQACENLPPPRKGVLTISTKYDNGNVYLAFADNGSGIKPENLQKIFEPFFTTKAVGKGTGLGLSIAYKIIEKHEGKISVQSEVGSGTTFTIELPVGMKQAPAANIFAD